MLLTEGDHVGDGLAAAFLIFAGIDGFHAAGRFERAFDDLFGRAAEAAGELLFEELLAVKGQDNLHASSIPEITAVRLEVEQNQQNHLTGVYSVPTRTPFKPPL